MRPSIGHLTQKHRKSRKNARNWSLRRLKWTLSDRFRANNKCSKMKNFGGLNKSAPKEIIMG